MNSIFGYPTVEAELAALINKANSDYNSDFEEGDLSFIRGEYNPVDKRQNFSVKDLSGRYFGIRDGLGFFKRDFQILFKGIEIHVQVSSGLTNRVIIDELSRRYGLPKFSDNDFADGLLEQNTDVGDSELLVSWPFSSTSFTWIGKVEFYLRNTKSSLTTLITDDHIDGFTPAVQSGILIDTVVTALPGLKVTDDFNLDDIIFQTDLEGLEYPNSMDLGLIITKPDLDGLDYPSSLSLNDLSNDLNGLDYYPSIALNLLPVADLNAIDYPTGTGTNRYSGLLLTRPLDFSDYQNAIQRFRVGAPINDANLVSVIVSKIMATFDALNNATDKAKLTLAFTNAVVLSIKRVRSPYGWRETVSIRPAASSFVAGDAVLVYDIETTE